VDVTFLASILFSVRHLAHQTQGILRVHASPGFGVLPCFTSVVSEPAHRTLQQGSAIR
jgi:hypothetical protein